MRNLLLACIAVGGILGASAVAHADPPGLYECPDTHSHVWHQDQCNDIKEPFGLPGAGGGGGHCGLICGVGKLLGDLGSLL